ncbi:MAG: hypothetical protein LBQ60_03370 [Bacteroidales bacterium]|jgi:hypothetical protein|nr:hypothetical protein [Bacteroidales bacterium]
MDYIDIILDTQWYLDICREHEDYIFLAKKLHPDICADARSIQAFTHLNRLKRDFEKGYIFRDESGEYRSNYLYHRWNGDKSLLKASKANYDRLLQEAKDNFDAKSFGHFMNYLPSNLEFEGETLVYRSQHKCVPLSKVIIRIADDDARNKHINWIYSRLIEFVSMLESMNITHAGLNPDSVFVIPEIHAIKVVTFYHTGMGSISTINGKYRNYYPAQLFTDKTGGAYVDISLIKKTAICGLGDVSGSGVKLRADASINQNVLAYLMTPESDAFQSMKTWRSILDTNFIKEFIHLNI